MRGRSGIDWPKEMHRPSSQVTFSPAWLTPGAVRAAVEICQCPLPRHQRNLTVPRFDLLKKIAQDRQLTLPPNRAESTLALLLHQTAPVDCEAAASRRRWTGEWPSAASRPYRGCQKILRSACVWRHSLRCLLDGLVVHARGHVRGVADRSIVHAQVVTDLTDNNQSCVQADAHLQAETALRL